MLSTSQWMLPLERGSPNPGQSGGWPGTPPSEGPRPCLSGAAGAREPCQYVLCSGHTRWQTPALPGPRSCWETGGLSCPRSTFLQRGPGDSPRRVPVHSRASRALSQAPGFRPLGGGGVWWAWAPALNEPCPSRPEPAPCSSMADHRRAHRPVLAAVADPLSWGCGDKGEAALGLCSPGGPGSPSSSLSCCRRGQSTPPGRCTEELGSVRCHRPFLSWA